MEPAFQNRSDQPGRYTLSVGREVEGETFLENTPFGVLLPLLHSVRIGLQKATMNITTKNHTRRGIKMKKIKRILIATDFSDCSKVAFNQAIQLARQLEATLLLAHVLEPINPTYIEPLGYLELNLLQTLDRMAHPLREEGLLVETHLFKGDPAAEIMKAAGDLQCDLIVMGTHGRTGVQRLLMGSVTERVLRASPVPIVAVRQQAAAENKKTLAKEETAAA